MKIIRIAKKDSKNVVIEFEDNEPLFLSVEVFMKSGLRKNDEISDDRFLFLVRENKIFYIKQRAFQYLGRRLHSRSELKVKLLQKRYESELINEVLNELENKNYIDDAQFARTFADEKIKKKLWGENKMKAELIKRGIHSNIINEILKEFSSDDQEFDNALLVAKKKYQALKNRKIDKDAITTKLQSFLVSKGFSYDVVNKVCNELKMLDK